MIVENEKNSKNLLEIKNLVKTYNKKRVVDDLSFSIKKAEIVGLIGPNGAGKTTSFYMTIGLIAQDSGSVFFNGKDITKYPVHKRAQIGMGYLSQEPSIFRSLSVEDNILCILETMNDYDKKTKEIKIKEFLEELNLYHLRKEMASTLSGGERRRLEIVRSLITKPSILLLDEPFANIDPIAINDVKNLILLLKKKNISVFITDHNAREIFSIVDRSYLMQDGKVLMHGTVDELVNNDLAKKHYLGKFEVEKVCLFARFKADTFIEKIESLINEGDMGIGKLDDTLFTLRSLSEIIKTEMEQRFDHPFVAKFREIHSKQFDQYLFTVERELSSFENHHKEKFLIASTEFIKSFLINLKLIEYLAEV